MGRLLFGPGARGRAVEAIQQCLALESVDGIYGHRTAAGVSQFQHSNRLPVTGATDDVTWRRLVKRPAPELFERCVALTAAFEGHGFSIARGNFDGAGLTWGIIGFTLRSGSLGEVLRGALARDAAVLERCFGERAAELAAILDADEAARVAWGNSIGPGGGLAFAWRQAFYWLGRETAAREAQLDVARRRYFEPASATARQFGFTTELDFALCFDVHVQNGGLRASVKEALAASAAQGLERRELLAKLVASTASERWREDVYTRKLTIAQGTGKVHGSYFELANWGLGDYAVLEPSKPLSD